MTGPYQDLDPPDSTPDTRADLHVAVVTARPSRHRVPHFGRTTGESDDSSPQTAERDWHRYAYETLTPDLRKGWVYDQREEK